jgi:hypothetical protein
VVRFLTRIAGMLLFSSEVWPDDSHRLFLGHFQVYGPSSTCSHHVHADVTLQGQAEIALIQTPERRVWNSAPMSHMMRL